MNPKLFAQAIVSIERKHGLRLNVQETWLRLDGTPCGRGWVGTKPGCKRGKSGESGIGKAPQNKAEPINPSSEKKGGVACGKGWEGTKPGCKRIGKGSKPELNADRKIESKQQQAKPQPKTEFVPRGEPETTIGGHYDIPFKDNDNPDDTRLDQISAIQKLTGMSEKEARSSINAISSYTSASYTSIRNVQRGIFKSERGEDLTKSEISEIQSSIKAIDQYVKKMPAFKGTIHRGVAFKSKEDQESFLSKISGGYSLEAMSSFSSSREAAKQFSETTADGTTSSHGVLFTVKNKSGASIQQLSENSGEEEVLVPKDVKYRIVGKPKKSGGVVLVEMEEI